MALDRSTLANWAGCACRWLMPLHDLILGTARSSPKLFADNTTLTVFDPDREGTKTGRLDVMLSMTELGLARAT